MSSCLSSIKADSMMGLWCFERLGIVVVLKGFQKVVGWGRSRG